MFIRFTWPLIAIGVVGALGYAGAQFNLFSEPCTEPITYTIGTFDSRFGVSRAEFTDALNDAAALWNEAAGKTVVAASEEGEVLVHLEYGTEQRTSELGEAIDDEQVEYDAAKAEFDALAAELEAAKRVYESKTASFERKADQYEKDVAYWNARGGAPQSEYQKLQATQRQLNTEQEALNAQGAQINSLIEEMNSRVDSLNRLAGAINRRVDIFNSNAHTDFDQGRYIQDEDGKRITIREFTEAVELRRVLAHEFGHALGLDHVENPDSIMYSYNVGNELALSSEDSVELTRVCKLD